MDAFLFKIKINAQTKFDENYYSSDGSNSLYDNQNKGHKRSAECLQRRRETNKLRIQRIRSDETDSRRILHFERVRLQID